MATCSNTSTYTNIVDLPRITNISNGDLLIVQSEDLTTTIDFQDLLIPLENTTFGGTISQIGVNTTNIQTLCTRVDQLQGEILKITSFDTTNPVTVLSTTGSGSGGTTRATILAALSSATPTFPWRTLQKDAKEIQDIPGQPINGSWTPINGLSINIARSTLNSKVRVQCSISCGVKIPQTSTGSYSAGFRIYRNGTPIGIVNDNNNTLSQYAVAATPGNNAINNYLLNTGNMNTVSFEIVDNLDGITESSITYEVRARSETGLNINAPARTTSTAYSFRGVSTITVTELV